MPAIKAFMALQLVMQVLTLMILVGLHFGGTDVISGLRSLESAGVKGFGYTMGSDIGYGSLSSQRRTTPSTNDNTTVSDEACFKRCEDDFPCDDKERKPMLTVFLLALLVGVLGVGRCYTGYICCGIAKGFTCAGCGIWGIIDWILILTYTWNKDIDGRCFEDWS